ncbi:hypothetical protein AAG906_018667 [Vitis piasezkii]
MASEKRMTVKLFCPSLSKVVSYVAREDQRLDLGSIARTFGLDPGLSSSTATSSAKAVTSSPHPSPGTLSFLSSRSLPTGAVGLHDPADDHENVLLAASHSLKIPQKIKLRETNSGCKDEDNLMIKRNGFGSKRKESVGDVNQPKKLRVHSTESGPGTNLSYRQSSCFQGSKDTLPSSILNTQFWCSHSENMKRMREDETVIPPVCKRTR